MQLLRFRRFTKDISYNLSGGPLSAVGEVGKGLPGRVFLTTVRPLGPLSAAGYRMRQRPVRGRGPHRRMCAPLCHSDRCMTAGPGATAPPCAATLR